MERVFEGTRIEAIEKSVKEEIDLTVMTREFSKYEIIHLYNFFTRNVLFESLPELIFINIFRSQVKQVLENDDRD
jgi:hypothetical protein